MDGAMGDFYVGCMVKIGMTILLLGVLCGACGHAALKPLANKVNQR